MRDRLLCGFVAAVSAGCVESFRGSNVQIDLPFAFTPIQASVDPPPAGQLPRSSHLRLYGVQEADGQQNLFELQRFELHRIVDLTSPCFIDVGERVPYPGLHVSQFGAMVAMDTGITDISMPGDATEEEQIDAATAIQRMSNVAALGGQMGIKVLSSASTTEYPPVAADCDGSESEIPPPTCTDEASNERRLRLCQETWDSDPDLWEGTDRILTSPLAGTTFGMVDGVNPVNLAPVGGASWFVDEDLDTMDAFALYWQMDGVDDDPGTLMLFGAPHATLRGTRHVELQSPTNAAFTAELVIFSDLDEDSVNF